MRKIVIAVTLVLVAAACGGSEDDLGGIEEEIIEQILDEASNQDVEVDFDSDDDGGLTVTIDDDEGDGQVTLGGGLPDDFPFPLPDEYEVGSSMEFEQDGGKTYSAVIHTGPEEFDDLAAMYESWLEDEGFEVNKTDLQGDGTKVVFLNAERDDARADISLSLDEVANDDEGNLIYATNISMTWTPQG